MPHCSFACFAWIYSFTKSLLGLLWSECTQPNCTEILHIFVAHLTIHPLATDIVCTRQHRTKHSLEVQCCQRLCCHTEKRYITRAMWSCWRVIKVPYDSKEDLTNENGRYKAVTTCRKIPCILSHILYSFWHQDGSRYYLLSLRNKACLHSLELAGKYLS